MKTAPVWSTGRLASQLGRSLRTGMSQRLACWVALATCIPLVAGCSSSTRSRTALPPPAEAKSQVLRPGDVVKIAFPRAATLDTTQQIRRDGKLNLYLVGEVKAAELTPGDLEKQLLELYSSQLVAKEVRVTVVSSAFAVFVTGAVVRPGKLMPERSLTAFEAVMEAGGFDPAKANTKAVQIIRTENGQTKNYTVDLKAVMEGRSHEAFYLQAYDTVFVPEKFSWF